MKKILVIGCPGSGKSCFSRALHQKTGIELCHLDLLYWNADKTTVERPIFLSRLSKILQRDAWIIDGNYASSMEMRLAACDTVFFLDYPAAVCIDGVRARRGKERTDMPWIETEEDAEFMAYIRSFEAENRPKILELLSKYEGKRVVVFRNRADADAFLQNGL